MIRPLSMTVKPRDQQRQTSSNWGSDLGPGHYEQPSEFGQTLQDKRAASYKNLKQRVFKVETTMSKFIQAVNKEKAK